MKSFPVENKDSSYCMLNAMVPVAMVLTIYGFSAKKINNTHGWWNSEIEHVTPENT